MPDKIKESSLLKSESEIIKNAGIRENTNIRIGTMFWRVVEYARTLVNNLYREIDNKVDKDGDKQLSDENFSTPHKEKLESLQNYEKPTSEPISYITGLQTELDKKIDKSSIVQTIPLTDLDTVVVSADLLRKVREDLKRTSFAKIETNRENYSLILRNIENDLIGNADLSFLIQNAFRIQYNQLTKSIELIDKKGNKSEIPVSSFVNNIPNSLSLTNYVIQLKSDDKVLSSISLADLFVNKNNWDNAFEHKNIIDGSNPHKTTFDSLIDKPTTLDGYGITDAVSKSGNKQLSDENFTTFLKHKLENLSNYVKPSSEPISYIIGLETRLREIETELNSLKQKINNLDLPTLVDKQFAR